MNERKKNAYVLARCILCGLRRKVFAGEVPAGEHPMCERDGMPLVPVRAVAGDP